MAAHLRMHFDFTWNACIHLRILDVNSTDVVLNGKEQLPSTSLYETQPSPTTDFTEYLPTRNQLNLYLVAKCDNLHE